MSDTVQINRELEQVLYEIAADGRIASFLRANHNALHGRACAALRAVDEADTDTRPRFEAVMLTGREVRVYALMRLIINGLEDVCRWEMATIAEVSSVLGRLRAASNQRARPNNRHKGSRNKLLYASELASAVDE